MIILQCTVVAVVDMRSPQQLIVEQHHKSTIPFRRRFRRNLQVGRQNHASTGQSQFAQWIACQPLFLHNSQCKNYTPNSQYNQPAERQRASMRHCEPTPTSRSNVAAQARSRPLSVDARANHSLQWRFSWPTDSRRMQSVVATASPTGLPERKSRRRLPCGRLHSHCFSAHFFTTKQQSQ